MGVGEMPQKTTFSLLRVLGLDRNYWKLTKATHFLVPAFTVSVCSLWILEFADIDGGILYWTLTIVGWLAIIMVATVFGAGHYVDYVMRRKSGTPRLWTLRIVSLGVAYVSGLEVFSWIQQAIGISIGVGIVAGIIILIVIAVDVKSNKDARVFECMCWVVAASVLCAVLHIHYFDALEIWLDMKPLAQENWFSYWFSYWLSVATPWLIFALFAFILGKVLALAINVFAPSFKIEGVLDTSPTKLASKLQEMYDNAPEGDATTMIRLFGIVYAEHLKYCGVPITEIAENSVGHSYHAEINKGIRLAPYVEISERAQKMLVQYK